MTTVPKAAADLESVARLSRDLRDAASTLSKDEARFLVDAYYMLQAQRIRTAAQIRAMTQAAEPHNVLKWLNDQSETLENQVKRALSRYAEDDPVGEWALEQVGIGPVITAGLLAHIDITKAPTVGHIWSFAGLDPRKKWEKGCRRPWNADLKRLCWLIGESFVKTSAREDSYYGKVYAKRKLLEVERNERCEFADQARISLETKRYGDDTKAKACYLEGKLPPARIHLRAERYAVKLFLSHLHEVWYRHHYNTAPPKPYPIAHLQHADYIPPPALL
jgi:hypothetical protein